MSGIQTYVALTNATVNLSGKCELHLTATNNAMTTVVPKNAMPGCIINLNSPDAWLFLDGTRPYVLINSNELNQIYVNGSPAVNGGNVRVVEYGMGSVVVPQSPSYLPLTVYSGNQFTGSSNQLSLYTFYNGSTTVIGGESGNMDVPFNGAIGSFILKRGYAATFAANVDGSGPSRLYVAAEGDIQVGALPPGLNGVGFIRCYPWIWKSKKGWAGGYGGDAPLVEPTWNYDWGAGAYSDPSSEYAPMQWGNGYATSINNKHGSTLLLGFNEPDSSSQANMTTTAALNDWTNLMNSGMRLGSPACTDGGSSSWLTPFINGADAAGMRVDTVEQHFYRCGYTGSSLQSWLLSIHNATGRRVGLTEFNNGANWACAAPDIYQDAAIVQEFISMMDTTPWVEGYNIYEWVTTNRQMVVNGVLTPAGTNYLNEWSPIGYIQELSGNPKWYLAVNGGVGPTNAVYNLNGDVRDSSGNDNDALLAGSHTFAGSGTNQALALDGMHDYVVLPPNVGKAVNFTFAAWVNWSGGAAWQRIFDLGFDDYSYLYLTPNSGSGTLRFAISTGGSSGEQAVETSSLTPGVWTHVAVTINGSTAKLFVNGVLAASSTTLTINPSQIGLVYCFLGKSQYFGDPLLKGALANVIIDGYALTDAQVAALAATPPSINVSVPATPTSLSATTVSSSQINLSWTASSRANSYNVKRATTSGGPYTTIVQGLASPNYSDSRCNAGTPYYYVVSAMNFNGESANSTEATATTLTGPPAAPTNLQGTPGHLQVSLRWSPSVSPGADSFNVKRADVSGGPYTTIATGVTQGNYTDTTVVDYGTYYYVVSGVNAYGESANSTEISVTPAIIPGNYSFESPYTGAYSYNPSGASWTFDANSGISANGSAFTAGNAVAPDGAQVAFLQKTCFVAQAVSGFVPGTTYTLSFWASQRQNKSGGQAGQTLDVLVDSTALVSGLAVPQTNVNYTQYAFSFTASATTHTLHFNGTDLNTGDNTLLIDDVQITTQAPTNAPAAPTGLTATAASSSQIDLSWNASAGATSYDIKRSTANGGPYTTIATGVTGTSFSDTGLSQLTTYYYVIAARNSAGSSANSAQASATTPAANPPLAPTGLTATAVSSSQINLNWSASSGATSYNVKRATVNGGPYVTVSNVTTTSTSDTGLSSGTTYYYVVSALNTGGESANSAQASALTIPATPTGVAATAGNSQVVLTWNADTGAANYNVKRATTSGGPYATVTNVSTTSFTDMTVTNRTTYYYVISALDNSGESANSSQVNALPTAPIMPYTNDSSTLVLFHFDQAAGGSVTTNIGSLAKRAYSVNLSTATTTPPVVTNVLGAVAFTNFGHAAAFTAGELIGWDANNNGAYNADNGTTLSADAITMTNLNMGNGGQTPWTLEALIYVTVTNANQEILASDSSATSRGFQFRISAVGKLELNLIATGPDILAAIPTSGANAYVPNTWYHVAATYDGTNIRLYWTRADAHVISANLISTTAAAVGTTFGAVSGPLCVGGENRAANGEYFQGRIDEVRISKTARAATGGFYW